MPDHLDVLLEILDAHAHLACDLGHLVVLQQAEVLGHDLLGRRAFEAEMPQLQQQTFLQIARRDSGGIEALNQAERSLDVSRRPGPHRGDFFEGGDQGAVVVQVADDRCADVAREGVVGLHRELPHQVV